MTTEFKYLKEGLVTDLAEFIMKDYALDMDTALELLYTSDTFAKVNDPATGLYFQGSKYVYTYLLDELKRGELTV